MTSFSTDFDNKYDVNSYEGTIETYYWIIHSVERLGFEELSFIVNFSFKTGDIYCHCDSLNDFIENAYGQPEYSFSSMSFSFFDKKKKQIFINIDFKNEIYISTESKVLLASAKNYLKQTAAAKKGEDEKIVNIENQNVYVNGDNNIVANNQSSVIVENVENNEQKKESKVKAWFSAIGQNLLSNWLWYVLGVLVSSIIVYFSSK